MNKLAAQKLVLPATIIAAIAFQLLPIADSIHQANAANLFWDPNLAGNGTTGGNAVTGNWDLGSTTAWYNGISDVQWTDSSSLGVDTADFAGVVGPVSLNANVSALGLIFGTTGYTISAGGGALNLGGSGINTSALTTGTTTVAAPINLAADQTWNIGTGSTTSITGGISSGSPVNLTKAGSGTLTLATTAGTWTGNAVVNAGTLNVNVAQSVASYTINGGTTNYSSAAPQATSFTLNGGVVTFGTASQSNFITGTINNGGRININTIASGTNTLAGGGAFTLNPGGTMSLANFMANNVSINVVGSGSTNATFLGGGGNNSVSANVMNALVFGNGNISTGMTALTAVDPNWYRSYGGTVTWTGSETIRFTAGTTSSNAPFTTFNTSTFTVQLNNKTAGGTLFLGALAGGTATTIGSYNLDTGSANTSTTYSGLFGGAVTKVGLGTWTVKPSAVNGAASNVNANGGILLADYGNLATPTNLFFNTSTLGFTGGTLDLLGKSGATTAQTFGAVTVAANGAGRLVLDTSAGASTTVNVTLGAITATAAGGSLNISRAGSGTTSVTTTTAPTVTSVIVGDPGTYGGRLTFTDASGNTDWATSTTATPFVLSGYASGNYVALPTAATTDTSNDVATGNVTLTGAVTTNSLKVTNTGVGQSLNLGGNALAVTNGGLLFTGANNYSISNGTLSSNLATNPDLILHHFGAGNLTIGATIVDGTTGATALTKAGTGTLTLSANNTYTGTTNLTGGTTSISADHQLGGGNGTVNVASSAVGSTAVTLTANAPAGFGVGSVFLGSTVTAVSGTSVTLAGTGATTALTAQDASWANTPAINLNGGTLSASTGLTLQETNSSGAAGTSTANRNIVLYGGGGTFDVPGSNNLAVTGVISSVNASNLGPLVKSNTAGTLTLAGTPAINFNITTTATSTDVTVDNSTGLVIGQTITGAGIPANATVTAINSLTDITISAAATATGSNPASAYVANSYGAATIIRGGTLSTAILVNGGINSGIGSSPSVAPALVLDGGNLQYTGAGGVAGTTDRTFTLTNNGGGLDATGNTGAVVFSNTAPIVADSTLAGTGARTLTLTGTSTLNNTLAGQIIDNSVTNKTSLSKTGAGTWILTNPSNTFTGNTTVAGGGVLKLSAASTNNIAGSSVVTINSGSTLNVTGLTSATMTLGSAQTLKANGTVTGSVIVPSGATVGGSGSIGNGGSGLVTINSGGILAPGSSIGTLSVDNLVLNSNSIMNYEFQTTPSAANDMVSTGGLTLGGGFDLYKVGTTAQWTTPGQYKVFQFSGSLSGLDSTWTNVSPTNHILNPVSGMTYKFDNTTNAGFITLTIGGTAPAEWVADDNVHTWSNGLSWSTGTAPNAVNATASFLTAITAPRTVNLDSPKTVGVITFNSSFKYTIVGSSTLTLDNTGSGNAQINDQNGNHEIAAPLALNSNLQIAVTNSGDTLTLSGGIPTSTTSSIIKSGLGTLALSGTNNYSGGTNITGGTVQFAALSSIGSGGVTLNSGTLKWGAGNTSDPSPLGIGLGGGGTLDTNGNNVTLSTAIGNGGAGQLTKAGTGKLILAANATYTGGTSITGGTLQVGNDASGAGQLGSGNVSISGGATLDFNRTDDINIANNISGTTGTLNKNNGNILTLSGNNTFGTASGGGVNLNGGTLQAGSATGIAGVRLAMAPSTVLDLNGFAASISSLTSDGTDLITNNLTTTTSVLTTTLGSATTYAGLLNNGAAGAGILSLTKAGNATLFLTNDNSMSGAVTVSDGGIQLNTGGKLDHVGAVTVSGTTSPSVLTVNGGSLTTSTAATINNNNGNTSTLVVNSGTATFSGGVDAVNNGNTVFLISVPGGILNMSSLNMGRTTANFGAQPAAGETGTGLYITGGQVNITGALAMATSNGANSSVSARIDSGSLTVGGPITVGLITTTGRWSVIDVNNTGTFTSTDTATGVQLGNFATGGSAELLVRAGGTATVQKVTFGPTANDPTETGVVNVTGTGSTLTVGSGGLSRGFVGGTIFLPQVQMGENGKIVASADFTSNANWLLNGTSVGPTLQTADATNVAHDVTITGSIGLGAVANAIATLTKTGGGTLTLAPNTTANSYTTLNLSAGNLVGNTDGLVGTINTASSSQSVTFNQNTVIGGATSGSTIAMITGPGNVVKTGSGEAILSNTNTYTGTSTVSQGRLTLQVSNAINQTSQVIMAGGTLGTNNTTQDFSTATIPATLKVTANSTIDLGGVSSTVKFANSNGTSVPAAAWSNGVVLRVSGWTGTPVTGVSDPEQLIVGTDTSGLNSAQLNHIHFTGYYTGAAFATAGLAGEVVPNTAQILKGDVNQDGVISVRDIAALMAALSNISGYESGTLTYSGSSTFVRANHATALDLPDTVDVADVDNDGFLTNLDIQSEINAVANLGGPGPGALPGGVNAVPEPASFVLLALGGLALACRCLQCRIKGRRNWNPCQLVFFAVPIDS